MPLALTRTPELFLSFFHGGSLKDASLLYLHVSEFAHRCVVWRSMWLCASPVSMPCQLQKHSFTTLL